jgi:hypothetical protein
LQVYIRVSWFRICLSLIKLDRWRYRLNSFL